MTFIMMQSPAKETLLLHSLFPVTDRGMMGKCTTAIWIFPNLAQYVLARLAQHDANYRQLRQMD